MRIIDFDASHIYQDSITEKKMTEKENDRARRHAINLLNVSRSCDTLYRSRIYVYSRQMLF